MSRYDNPGRQQRDSQQEGFSSQNRQQGSQDPAQRFQGGHGRDDHRGDHGGSDINNPAGGGAHSGEQSRDRAPYESNYGYESNHPSYQARGAGDWSGRSGESQSLDQRGQREQEQFDPDYHQWRREQGGQQSGSGPAEVGSSDGGKQGKDKEK